MSNSLNLSPVEMPHAQKPLKRLSGRGLAHVPISNADTFRTEFFMVLDVVNMQFQKRFEQEGLFTVLLKRRLLTGEFDGGLLEQHPKLLWALLRVQLAMFKSKCNYQSTTEAAGTLQNMMPTL